jgi:GNAT superfamily N-acetyltransferase
VASIDGEAVATSGVHLAGGIACLFNVATVPAHRRQGIGAAMSRTALAAVREEGCRRAYLGASDLGRNVYRQMGFRDVFVNRVFVWRPGADP